MSSNTIGSYIENKLEQKEMSWYRLSKNSGVCQATIHRIRKGEIEPSLITLKKIAKALGVKMVDIIKQYEKGDCNG